MGNTVDTVEDRILDAILSAIDYIFTPRIELAVRSINASSVRDATSVTVNSEREERIGIIASLENVCLWNNKFHKLNTNVETRGNIPCGVSELSQGNILTGNRTLVTNIVHDHTTYGTIMETLTGSISMGPQ